MTNENVLRRTALWGKGGRLQRLGCSTRGRAAVLAAVVAVVMVAPAAADARHGGGGGGKRGVGGLSNWAEIN